MDGTGSLDPRVGQRIRRPARPGCHVLPRSLPVISFGNAGTAAVATLALNPSDREFKSPSGEWLEGGQRRLESLHSLGVDDPRDLTDQQVTQALTACHEYFQGNWYRQWFHWLQSLLVTAQVGNFLEGTACHLDLVQWATHPKQAALPAKAWSRLVEEDEAFLRQQLAAGNLKALLVNGRGVVDQLRKFRLVETWDEDVLESSSASPPLHVYRGSLDGVLAIGWNMPVAQAITKSSREALAAWVGEQVPQATSPN